MSLQTLFRAESLPVFQNKMFLSREAALSSPTGDVILTQDMNSGLIFNSAFKPELLEYDADYQNEQAHSGVFQDHLRDVTLIIDKYFHGKSLIEVGCGKGYFLGHLKKHGYQITGIDPAYEEDDQDVIVAKFEAGLGITADAIVLRHVLEHMINPVEFLKDVVKANDGKGLIYIEVPCLDWICHNKAWFDVFYEHVNYFRMADFYRMFGRVIDAGHVFGGQYLYIVADLATLRMPRMSVGEQMVFPQDFLSDIDTHARRIVQNRDKQNAVWGSASKGVIFSLYMQRAGAMIETVIDINPAKQGKYIASTGLQVLSPELAMRDLLPSANMFVMNSIYLDEIIRLSNNQYHYLTVEHHAA